MCQINEKLEETVECKQICCKMQKQSLRVAIDNLKNNHYHCNTTREALSSIYNVLETYSCLPGTCLCERVEWVCQRIPNNTRELYVGERINLDMLISELEAFLGNS